MDKSNFRTIQSIGRSELIKELTEQATVNHPEVIKGVGDDAAVIQMGGDYYRLHTSESFMEGVDFDLTYMPLHHLGYKVMSALVSDIYAMNGTPETALVNLAVPNKLSVDMLKKIYEGIYTAGTDYNVQIVGGDLTASHQTLAMSLSCTGRVNKTDIVYRKGARPKDAICVSGDLGGALAGLRILMREKQFWQKNQQQAFQPDLEDYAYVVERQLVPKARQDLVDQFDKNEIIPNAMIDVTQGLVHELKQLTDASGVGAQLYQAALPVAPQTREVANEMKEDVDRYALYGGEDLELLFTLPPDRVEEAAKSMGNFTVIGKIADAGEGIKMQTAEGDVVAFGKDDS